MTACRGAAGAQGASRLGVAGRADRVRERVRAPGGPRGEAYEARAGGKGASEE